MTNPTANSEGQSTQGGETGAGSESAQTQPPPDRSWIEFDIGIRSQDPDTITRKG